MPRVPKYRRHKPTNRALVEIKGQRIYLGRWGTAESKERYRRLVAEFMDPDKPPAVASAGGGEVLVKQIILAYWEHVQTYYVKNGRPTSEQATIRGLLKNYVRPLYGDTPARTFTPLCLDAIRAAMIEAGLSRGVVNQNTGRVRRMFKWAASRTLVAGQVYHDLMTLSGLRSGRTTARETEPVAPVDEQIVEATLAELSAVVADMVRVQRLTGCRPSEACMMRPTDIDRSAAVWQYRPESHKTEHHGRGRVVFVGHQAQEVLLPYLLRAEGAYCFSPREADGSRRGTERGERYTRDSYRRAIHRACDRAGVARWSPNRLRHNAATEIRKRFGLEAAQCVLGHSNAAITEVYAERDAKVAEQVMREMG